MVIFEYLRAHSDFVLLSLLALIVWYRKGRDITVSELFKHEFNKFILLALVIFFVAVTVYAEQHASKLAEAMLDLIKTVVGALLILINSKQQQASDPSPSAPNPPAQGGA